MESSSGNCLTRTMFVIMGTAENVERKLSRLSMPLKIQLAMSTLQTGLANIKCLPLRTLLASGRCIVLLLAVNICGESPAESRLHQETGSATDASANVESLVQQLGDSNPAIRRAAETSILEIGPAACPALRQGLRNTNPEVSGRCMLLLQRLNVEAAKLRSNAFLLLDADDPEMKNYPAWPAFERFAGADLPKNRELFVAMCDSLTDTFEDCGFKTSSEARSLKHQARLLLGPNQHSSSAMRLTGYLFLCDEHNYIARAEDDRFTDVEILEALSFMQEASCVDAVRESPFRDQIESLFVSWLPRILGDIEAIDGPVKDALWELAFRSRNALLLQDLAAPYTMLTTDRKVELLDCIAAFGSPESDADSINSLAANSLVSDAAGRRLRLKALGLLKPALGDDTVVLRTRLRKRPAEQVELRVSDLAFEVAAQCLRRADAKDVDKIKTEQLFGGYRLSGNAYSRLVDERDRAKIRELLDSFPKQLPVQNESAEEDR